MSCEVKSLETEVNKLLGGWCDLDGKIKSSVIFDFDQDKNHGEEFCKPNDCLLLQDYDQDRKYISDSSQTPALDIKNTEDLHDFDKEYRQDYQLQNQQFQYLKDFKSNHTFQKFSDCNHSFATELLENEEIGNNALYRVDLSKLSDIQKHIALRGKDTEIVEITTADNNQYFGRLKAMEVNENGELIITFIQNSQKEFIKNKEIFSLNAGNKISDLQVKKDQLTRYQYNTTESYKNVIEFTQEGMQGFKGLNEVVSGIFDKLLHIKSDGS
jgi:hypothetical protein